MTAGFTKGQYFDDTSAALVVKVESDHFANAQLGWTAPAGGTRRTGYGSTRPRRVHGVNITGGVVKRATLIVPSLTADAWQEATGSFTDKDQDGSLITYTVTSRVGEVRRYGV